MRQSTLLILNTVLSYARMLVTVCVGILITRLQLGHLGGSDFGLLNLLTTTVGVGFILADGLQDASDRSLAFYVGKGSRPDLRAMFSTLIAFFALAALAALVLGAIIAPIVLLSYQIDDARSTAATWAFALALPPLALRFIVMPFRGILFAHQRFFQTTIAELTDASLNLAAILVAIFFFKDGDRLITFSVLLCFAQFLSTLVMVSFALRAFPDLFPSPKLVSMQLVRSLKGLIGWLTLSRIGFRIRVAAPAILIGLAFTDRSINAAFGIAMQLALWQYAVAWAIGKVAQPAMVNAEGRGDRARVIHLVPIVSKYCSIMVSMFLVPILLQTDTLLQLWLGQGFNEHMPLMTQFVMAAMSVMWLWIGWGLATTATGRLRPNTIATLTCDCLGLLVSAVLLLVLGLPGWTSPAAFLFAMIIAAVWCVRVTSRQLGMPFRDWPTLTLWPVAKVVALAGAAALGARWLVPADLVLHLPFAASRSTPAGLLQLLAVTGVYCTLAIPATWLLAMPASERAHFTRLGGSLLHRAGLRRKSAA